MSSLALNARATGRSRRRHLNKSTRPNIENVTVDRNVFRHERMLTDTLHVLSNTLLLLLNRVPFDEVPMRTPVTILDVRPSRAIKRSRFKVVLQEAAHHLIGEQLHAAIRMVNNEPLIGAEQLVRDHKRPDRIVGGSRTSVADYVRVAFRETGILCGIQSSVHACQNRKFARWRQGQILLSSEIRNISFVCFEYFRVHLRQV